MNPNDFVFNSVYREALKKGASDRFAKDAAVMAMDRYKTNRFSKVDKLISESIKNAVHLTKKSK